MGRSPDDKDHDVAAERFFSALGRSPTPSEGTSTAGARAVRDAVLAEDRILREAAGATEADLTADERGRMENVRRMLVSQGALDDMATDGPVGDPNAQGSAAKASSARTMWRGRLQEWLCTPLLGRGLAFASVVAICTVLVLQGLPGRHPAEEEVLRGGEPAVLQVTDPAGEAERFVRQLRDAGAEVAAVPLNDDTWVIEFDVPASARPAVEALARARSLTLAGDGPFVVKLQRRP